MSYYPILIGPGCSGWTTLCNFSPNNWEATSAAEKHVNVTWAEKSGVWKTRNLGVLALDEMRTITTRDIVDIVPDYALPFLSLTSLNLPAHSDILPYTDVDKTLVPAWRSTLGLSTDRASTSYQGEIDPFPVPGSLLTFSPFIQVGDGIENYMIFVNLEKQAVVRTAEIEIYDCSKPDQLRGVFEVRNNTATVVGLDNLGFETADLPLIVSRKMSGIPLYFSKTRDGSFLSLEHTHPPASFVIHGKRWEIQKRLKHTWFLKLAE